MQWVSRITTVSLEMIVPGLIGLWIDHELGILRVFPVFLVLGVILGVAVGIYHLVRMAAPPARGGTPDRGPSDDPSK